MQWTQYHELIVDRHHVALENWLLAVLEAEGVRLKDLEPLLGLIESGECKWKKLDDLEIEEHRQVLAAKCANSKICKRKGHSDKGRKRGSYKKQSNTDKENEVPGNSESEQDNQDQSVPQRANPLSRENLSDTNEN